MNCVLHLKPHLHLPRHGRPIQSISPPPTRPPKLQPSAVAASISRTKSKPPSPVEQEKKAEAAASPAELIPRWALVGGASLGLALLLAGVDQALAMGPEGPLVEEFWDNVRRYVLYALTVSTGAIYTISQPIIELLKNPVTAVLILIVLAGTLYLLSQVLSAMIGVSEFSYDYAY